MKDLNGKNIIVTGASGGIGYSIIEKLDKAGANILASGTKIEKLNELKNKYVNIKTLRFDISQSNKIDEFVEENRNRQDSLRRRNEEISKKPLIPLNKARSQRLIFDWESEIIQKPSFLGKVKTIL